MPERCADLVRFVRGEIDPASFPHREHVRMAFEMLRRHDFIESALHYSHALRAMLQGAGRPAAFHQTVTLAFLSLIAERMQSGEHDDFDSFASANPDLMDRSVLDGWYHSDRLGTDLARRIFLLPDRTA